MINNVFKIKPWIIGIILIISIVFPIRIGINMVDSLPNNPDGITKSFMDTYSLISLIIPLFYLIWLMYVALGLYIAERIRKVTSKFIMFIVFWFILLMILVVNPFLFSEIDHQFENYNIIFGLIFIISVVFVYNYIIQKLSKLVNGTNPRFKDYLILVLNLVIYPIGCWNLQSRINKIYSEK